jgi:peptide/nickel transport system permease protein
VIRSRKIIAMLAALFALHLCILFAGFLSPYDPVQQNRDLPFVAPTRIHFARSRGAGVFRPFVCAIDESQNDPSEYLENCQRYYPVYFFVRGAQYDLFGLIHSNLHLFGVSPSARIFLMGTDDFGRDIFSRFLFGGKITLFAGLFATGLSLALGTILGILSGYYGGSVDAIVMRSAELFLALPWLYLLFALRAFLPLSLNAVQAFLLLIAVIGIVGWARPARMIRGVVLSSRERHYVLAARLFGGSDSYLIYRHILPDTFSIITTQAALLVPQYVLAEVVLSFLGLGVGEPTPSWGNMLAKLQDYAVLVSYSWILIPGLMLIPVFLGYFLLASELSGRATERL